MHDDNKNQWWSCYYRNDCINIDLFHCKCQKLSKYRFEVPLCLPSISAIDKVAACPMAQFQKTFNLTGTQLGVIWAKSSTPVQWALWSGFECDCLWCDFRINRHSWLNCCRVLIFSLMILDICQNKIVVTSAREDMFCFQLLLEYCVKLRIIILKPILGQLSFFSHFYFVNRTQHQHVLQQRT